MIVIPPGTRTTRQNSRYYSETRPNDHQPDPQHCPVDAVLAAVLSLLVWSIATQHRGLPRAEIHTRTHRAIKSRRAPHEQPDPVRA